MTEQEELRELGRAFEQSRQSRGGAQSHYPKNLWNQAVELSRRCSNVIEVAKACRVMPESLRVHVRRAEQTKVRRVRVVADRKNERVRETKPSSLRCRVIVPNGVQIVIDASKITHEFLRGLVE